MISSRTIIITTATLIASLLATVVSAQSVMEEMVITGARGEIEVGKTPASVNVIGEDVIQTGQQQLTLDESLSRVPGVFLQNTHNFAQAQRISIRGFGARSAFGIRGIKLIVDGVPATMPDGQGNVDEIDLGSVRRIEVIRGPSSSLYGSASGGVINVFTEDGPEDPFIQGRISIGEFGFQQYQLKTGGQHNKLNYLISGTITDLDGNRENSFVDRKGLNTKLSYEIDPKGKLTASVNILDVPKMGDPGALTEAQVETDRKAARDRNLSFDGSEKRSQKRFGFTYQRTLAENHELLLKNYYTFLNFANKLPFEGTVAESSGGQVQFDRTLIGGGGQYTYSENILDYSFRLIAGIDIDYQKDNRRRFVNQTGGIRGELTLDQLEEVISTGAYIQSEFALLEDVQLTLGARFDDVEFKVTDRFLDNNSGDDSGKINFKKLSPRLGLLWNPVDWANMFFNFSTAFETPTTTEFADPDGVGFNQDLSTQRASNLEVGMKGAIQGRMPVDYEVAIFRIVVRDELVQFEDDRFPGRNFFRNAGKSTRKGFEAGITAEVFPTLTASLAYSYIKAEFDRFRIVTDTLDGNTIVTDTFDGNTIPGIPNQHLHAEVRYDDENGWFSILDLLFIDEFFADNGNQVKTDPYAVSNFRLGYKKELDNWIITPYMSVNNLFNEKYNSNVRVNAFGGRYFEPAPLRNVYGGVSVRLTF